MSRGNPISPLDVVALRSQLVASGQGVNEDEIRRHLHTIGAPDIGPDVAGIDALDFRVQIPTTGLIAAQPTKQTLPGGFWAELFEVRAWMQDPATDPETAALVTFNVKDSKRSGNLFSTDWYIASLLNPAGGLHPAHFPRGLYRFDPGSDISVKFTVDNQATVGYSSLISAVKHFGVTLLFNLYAVEEK